jgi:hypothetical protein
MEDSKWLESVRFYALPLAEKWKLLLARQEKLQEQRTRLELQGQELEAQQARLALQQLALENQLAKMGGHLEEVFAPRLHES